MEKIKKTIGYTDKIIREFKEVKENERKSNIVNKIISFHDNANVCSYRRL
jgi:hypothetical protein